MSGYGILSLAEIKIYSDKLNTFDSYDRGTPVQTSAVTYPYQASHPFSDAFKNYKIDGRWNIKVVQDDSNDNPDQTSLVYSYGTISDVVLVITDYAGMIIIFFLWMFFI